MLIHFECTPISHSFLRFFFLFYSFLLHSRMQDLQVFFLLVWFSVIRPIHSLSTATITLNTWYTFSLYDRKILNVNQFYWHMHLSWMMKFRSRKEFHCQLVSAIVAAQAVRWYAMALQISREIRVSENAMMFPVFHSVFLWFDFYIYIFFIYGLRCRLNYFSRQIGQPTYEQQQQKNSERLFLITQWNLPLHTIQPANENS